MTVPDQLKFGDHIFKQVESFRSLRRISDLSELISNTYPPEEWIVELQSIANPKDKFKSMKLELLEALAKRIFGYYKLEGISQPIISHDKQGNVSVTINVEVEVRWFDGTIRKYPGIATEIVPSMRLLPLATPKASSMAVKNALKQIGKLFGKYLNNDVDDAETPIVESQPTIEDQTNAVTQGIIMSNNISDLKSWRSLVYSKMGTKEQQDLYETKLRQLTN